MNAMLLAAGIDPNGFPAWNPHRARLFIAYSMAHLTYLDNMFGRIGR
jgi:hypothetical protein